NGAYGVGAKAGYTRLSSTTSAFCMLSIPLLFSTFLHSFLQLQFSSNSPVLFTPLQLPPTLLPLFLSCSGFFLIMTFYFQQSFQTLHVLSLHAHYLQILVVLWLVG